MARYSANNRLAGTQQANSTTFKSQLSLAATTANLVRGSLIDIVMGADSAPNATDTQIVYDISRTTADGTSTAVTPNPVDQVSSVAATTGKANFTAEGTVTAASSLYVITLNQRSSLRVFFDQGLRWPATAANGLVMRSLSPIYAGNTLITAVFDE